MNAGQKTGGMRRRIGALAVLGGGLCLTAWTPQGAVGDQSSPKATVRAFIAALDAKNGDALAACIRGAHASPAMQNLLNTGTGPFGAVKAAQVNELVAQGDADHATVAAEVSSTLGNGPHETVEVFRLERSGGKWLILPDAGIADQMTRLASDPGPVQIDFALRPISTLTVMVAFPDSALKELEQARVKALGISCLSNMKQIDLGAVMYTQDNDEKMPPRNAAVKQTLMPYVKSDGPFQCPLDPPGTVSYSFNANVQGANLAAVAEPARTVMLYEGKNMQLNFRHDGKAVVGFVDGHARLVGPDEAKGLIWNLAGKTPKPAPKGKTGK